MPHDHHIPVITDYTAKRGISGKVKSLAFACPGCRITLKADLEDAGRSESCPRCGAPFRVPQHDEPPPLTEPVRTVSSWKPPPTKPAPMPAPMPPSIPVAFDALRLAAGIYIASGRVMMAVTILASVVLLFKSHKLAALIVFGSGIGSFFTMWLIGHLIAAVRSIAVQTRHLEDVKYLNERILDQLRRMED